MLTKTFGWYLRQIRYMTVHSRSRLNNTNIQTTLILKDVADIHHFRQDQYVMVSTVTGTQALLDVTNHLLNVKKTGEEAYTYSHVFVFKTIILTLSTSMPELTKMESRHF